MRKALMAAVAAFVIGGSVASLASGIWTNGVPASLGNRGNGLLPMDAGPPGSTNGAAGTPLSQAISPAQIAGLAIAQAANTGTTSSGAVTVSKANMAITTESLSTAVGATYTVTVTDTYALATSNIQCSGLRQVSDVTAARFVTQSVTPAAGSFVLVFYNNGTASASGTWAFGCSVFNN